MPQYCVLCIWSWIWIQTCPVTVFRPFIQAVCDPIWVNCNWFHRKLRKKKRQSYLSYLFWMWYSYWLHIKNIILVAMHLDNVFKLKLIGLFCHIWLWLLLPYCEYKVIYENYDLQNVLISTYFHLSQTCNKDIQFYLIVQNHITWKSIIKCV